MPARHGRRWAALIVVAGLTGLLAVVGVGSAASARPHATARVRHVLLLSADGLHESDLRLYVRRHPASALAALVRGGVEFDRARTPVPSDSFPGLIGQVTGGNPSSTGVYYDDSWNRALLPAGTTRCRGVAPGAEVTYSEDADKDPHALDGGQGLAGLPGSILRMTGNPRSVLDPKQLPVDPRTCKPVYPHSYLRANTIFEVARGAGLRTAWSDKHPAYDIVNGPSGRGVQDLFTPEINSDAPRPGASNDWTTDNLLTQRYDAAKVRAVINEIHGLDHSGARRVGTPAIFGMNFQSISTAEKLPSSQGRPGGYRPDGKTPGPVLSRALGFLDREVGAMRAAIRARHLQASTVIILSAKHGQSPQRPAALTRIPDGPITDALDAAWKAAHPTARRPLVAFSIDDDAMLVWLNDRSAAATSFAARFLLAHAGTGNDITGAPKAYRRSGLAKVYAGAAAARYFGVSTRDARVPDLLGIAQYGVVYTGKQGKIAEHGGAGGQDRHVPLVVSGAAIDRHGTVDAPVETTRIAPTILKLLGLNPRALRAVRSEGTRVLPMK